ncbi:MAG: 3-dehydroquinate synthase [Muribaculaceae bacterium]|nr:3-dehydroquinate synthase [Muribaculaceae bacterium]
MNQKVIFTTLVGDAIDDLVSQLGAPQIFVIVDVNTAQYVLPVLKEQSKAVQDATVITVKAGDAEKTLENTHTIWKELHNNNATRSSVVINVGGGVVTDLGGFAAATYKRGLRVINVPTTVLGAVDAAIGGKTGINYNGYKNEIGTFTEPIASVITSDFFNTLSQQELLSGYAEMLKHGLLESDEELNKLLAYSVVYPIFDAERLLSLIETSVQVKQRVVEADFNESGYRKVLNLGHTFGHAFETLALKRQSPIPHGFAVAQGCVAALVLSHMKLGFPSETLQKFADYVRKNYNAFAFTCDDYDFLYQAMLKDKKNLTPDTVAFTLLEEVGKPKIEVPATKEEIASALDIYRDLMGI